MAVADAVISYAVEKTGDLILQQAKYLNEVSGKVEQLRAELTRMRCFLRDAELRQGDSISIRNWVAEIRNIAYDAEDVLEIYALKDASRSIFPRCGIRWRDPISVYKVGAAIDGIAARLTNLTTTLPAYGLKELQDGERAGSLSEKKSFRRSYSYKIDQNIVGLEEDTNLLLTQLQHSDCRVVSICGMAGLGKTTLAKKVYHQCKVGGGYFDFFIWIFVSQQWGKRNIWETILNELLSPPQGSLMDEEFAKQWKRIQRMRDDGVAKLLHDELRKKECLVVLDDIWDNVWEALSPAFPTEETSSKFMITTRNKSLAQGFIHEPRCLNGAQSWELFTKTAIPSPIIHSNPAPAGKSSSSLPSVYKMDERMEILGKEMVKHCGGLPLAIVVLGGILKHKETSVEWETIHQCIKSYLKGEVIFRLLALSYDDLPYELKPCFLYLAMFPEDFEISVNRLINLWVAEGLIHPPRVERRGEEALEDIGYRYLTELAERYMIVVAKRDSIGRIKRCQMHDLMREFCLSKSEEENFSHVVPLYGTQTQSLNISSSSVMATGRIRRLSLHLNKFPGNVALECEKYPPFKTLLGFSLDQLSGLSQRLTTTLVHSFKLLRIMDLQSVKHFVVPKKTKRLIKKTSKLTSANWKFNFKSRTKTHTPGMVRLGRVIPAAPQALSTTMPKTIGKLIHLRLLSFGTGYDIPKLPSSIGNLSCLLTLRIDFHYVGTLPNVFWKLKRLRHLYLPRWIGMKTKRLEFSGLTDLQTLVNFPTYCADLQDLITLTNLRRLKIEASGIVSIQKLQMIFMPPSITFKNLRDLSISDSPRPPVLIDDNMRDNIKSCCPRLLLLKTNGNVVYQKTVDVFRLEEDQLP